MKLCGALIVLASLVLVPITAWPQTAPPAVPAPKVNLPPANQGGTVPTLTGLLLGGIEQTDLSSQNSVTEGFYDLFLDEEFPGNGGSLWFRSRYLGSPSSSSTANVVAATTNPSGTLTASNLPQSVAAVDYLIGYRTAGWTLSDEKMTLNPIVAFGGTSPLSATSIVAGYQVPAYGTSECNELQKRFTVQQGYNPPLPPPGMDSSGQMDCVVMPDPTGGSGTKVSYIGFSNEDRSSFLLKWGAGVRLTDRWNQSDDDCTFQNGCTRLFADFTVGQDEAFTGGLLRHFVFKGDARVPIMDTGLYFFAASANRIERNQTLSPLILTPVTLATSTSTATCNNSPPNSVCFPAADVFILPYKQPDRDYYRIGVGIDAMKILNNLFGKSSSNTAKQP